MPTVITPLNRANKTQNFYPMEGEWLLKQMPMKASVVIADGSAVMTEVTASNPTGYVTAATTTFANGQNFAGILAEPIASTDADYATAGKMKSVWVPKTPGVSRCYFTVGSGTHSAAQQGRTCALASATGVAVATNGNQFIISPNGGFISTTRGIGTFAMPNIVTA